MIISFSRDSCNKLLNERLLTEAQLVQGNVPMVIPAKVARDPTQLPPHGAPNTTTGINGAKNFFFFFFSSSLIKL